MNPIRSILQNLRGQRQARQDLPACHIIAGGGGGSSGGSSSSSSDNDDDDDDDLVVDQMIDYELEHLFAPKSSDDDHDEDEKSPSGEHNESNGRQSAKTSGDTTATGANRSATPASSKVTQAGTTAVAAKQQAADSDTGSPAAWQLERKYTLSEVQQHCSLDDCWMVIFDKVYNITDFVYEHPGGDFILLEYAGRDATHPFLSSRHGSLAYKMLDKYWIGILVDEELYYSNNSSYCSVYSSLSWRSTPTLEDNNQTAGTTASSATATYKQ